MKYQVKAIINFNDLEENTHRVVGDVFEASERRKDYLLEHKAIEVIEEVKETKIETINKDNIIEKLEEAQEKILNEEIVETIPVVDRNNVVVDRVVKDKSNKNKKSSKK